GAGGTGPAGGGGKDGPGGAGAATGRQGPGGAGAVAGGQGEEAGRLKREDRQAQPGSGIRGGFRSPVSLVQARATSYTIFSILPPRPSARSVCMAEALGGRLPGL